jgi:hypothetical protein
MVHICHVNICIELEGLVRMPVAISRERTSWNVVERKANF